MTAWRRVVMVGAPLALAVLEAFHPRPGDAGGGSEALDAISQGDWFLWFHMIQLPLIGLTAWAVYLLTAGLDGRAAVVSRWAAGVFAMFFSAYDAAAGVATGYVWRNAQDLPPADQELIFEATEAMPNLSIIFLLSVVGTGAWVVALVSAAVALRRVGVGKGPYVLLILAGVFLMGGHPFPFGTIAFGCLSAAAVWLEVSSARPVPDQGRTMQRTPR
jgi:hypothetical protein